MTDVHSIPGVQTVHPRSAWEWPLPKYQVNGPACPWPAIDTSVIHYTAADDLIDGDPGESADDLPAYIRNMQASYINSRDYSVGYLWAVDWLGGAWQLRGWEYKSAANKYHNHHTAPILVLVDGADRCTDEAAHTIRCIVAEAQRRSNQEHYISGHGQLRVETGVGTPTACCGRGLQDQTNEGVFYPSNAPVGPPIHPPPSGDDMIVLPTSIRMFDSRWWDTKLPEGKYELECPANVPVDKALSITVTAVQPDGDGYMTVWQSGPKPIASCLNFQAGNNNANTTSVSVKDRKFWIYASTGTHCVIDVVGYQ